jgi:hypothetical protein
MNRFAAISMLLCMGSYSQAAPADQTPAQIRQLAAPLALRPNAPVPGISSHSNAVLEGPRLPQHLSLNVRLAPEVHAEPWDPGLSALTQFPSAPTELNEALGPEVPNLPAYDLWHLEVPPLLAEPGWMPIEGTLVGPGISFGLGFPIRYLGER